MNNDYILYLIFIAISDINWTYLKDSTGISAICFDKDNTLTAPYDDHVHASVKVIQSCPISIM